MSAAAGKARRLTIVSARDAAMEHVNRQDERLRVAGPGSPATCPTGARGGAVIDTTAETAAIVALPDAKTSNVVTQPGAAKLPEPLKVRFALLILENGINCRRGRKQLP
jgi:hypothetical protein